MKIVSWNVNGIRAVEKKAELGAFIKKNGADIVLLQETKGSKEKFGKITDNYKDYEQFYHAAQKPGYSGTSIWVKKSLRDYHVSTGMNDFDDNEGRIMRVDIDDYAIFGVYFPNGGKSDDAWQGKLVFYEKFLQQINDLRNEGKKVIFAGDVNCAHQEIDLARPKDNDGKIGFHPKERAWMDKLGEDQWIDVFRERNPDEVIYSWWHLLSGARKRNVGWRIDYFFIDGAILDEVKSISYDNDQMGSDHCPVILELK